MSDRSIADATPEGNQAAPPRQVEQAEAAVIQADQIVMTRSAAREVNCREARLDRSAVFVVDSSTATISNSSCVQVLGEDVTVVNTPSLMVAAERARIQGSPIFFFLGSIEGDGVKPVLDWRSGLAVGAGLGLALAVAGRFLRGR